jgi:hypothetical protein
MMALARESLVVLGEGVLSLDWISHEQAAVYLALASANHHVAFLIDCVGTSYRWIRRAYG